MTHPAVNPPNPNTDPPDEAVVIVGPWDPKTLAPEHVHTIEECSPLHGIEGGAARWSGRIVTDPAEIAAIRRRVEASVEPGRFRAAWRRRLRWLSRNGVGA